MKRGWTLSYDNQDNARCKDNTITREYKQVEVPISANREKTTLTQYNREGFV